MRYADFVCLSCLHRQGYFLKPCDACGSRRIEHADFLRIVRGEHWRELLLAERGSVH